MDIEQLLVDWLSELVYIHDVEHLVFGEFDVEINEKELRAKAYGEEYDISKHGYGMEIKAVTYHMLEVKKDKKGYVVRYPFERGKLKNIPRTLDFIIPSKSSPKIIIECSYVVTTSSGMGDKAKTEQRVAEAIKKHYSKALFIGFVDGIGWYVRRGDLKRMIKAYDFVFTFRADEIEKFKKLLTSVMGYKNERFY